MTMAERDYYTGLLDASEDVILVQDGAQFVDCNQAALDLFQYPTKAEFLNTADGTAYDLFEANRAHAPEHGSHHFEWVLWDAANQPLTCTVSLTPFDWHGKTLLRATIRDLEIHRAAERRRHAYFKSLFDNSPEGLIIVDDQDHIINANPGFEQMFQWTHDELVGHDLNQFIIPADRRQEAATYSQRALDGTADVIAETVRLRQDGSEVRVSLMGAPVFSDGQLIGACGIYRDMTSYYHSREQLHESQQHLRTVVENLPVILFMLDADGIFTLTQGLGLKSLGRQSDDYVGQCIFDACADRPTLLAGFRQALIGRANAVQDELSDVMFETQLFPLRDGEHITGVIGLSHDVTEKHEIKRHLEHMAHHDGLTGLPNRTLFRQRAEATLADARPSAILFVDLDGFKTINDSLGHAVGDRVLRTVADRFTEAVRATDTVARLGGDEFGVLIADVARPAHVTVVAHKLMEALSEPIHEAGMALNTSACIGISVYPNDGDDVDALLRNADAAMYDAKREDRSTYRFFAPEMNTSALESLVLGNHMHTALARGEFLLYYQPVTDLASNQITGFEALVRWYHPERGLLSPAQFIPVAEDTGLIKPLGEWVVAEAARQTSEWVRAGYPALRMAVNLSGQQFRDWGLVERFDDKLKAANLPPEQLLIEITESIMLPDPKQTRAILNRFQAMGIPVAIDDFGTGYSSLAYLRDFPIDYLKIDQSFVRNVPHDTSACTIVNTIIAMAKNLDLRVIAEGVETAEQLAFLRDSHCDEIQGYYLGRPMSAADATALLAARA